MIEWQVIQVIEFVYGTLRPIEQIQVEHKKMKTPEKNEYIVDEMREKESGEEARHRILHKEE